MAALQEAALACLEDEEAEESSANAIAQHASKRSPPTHVISLPRSMPMPQRGAAVRAPAFECVGSGTFFMQNDALKHRFLCWRVTKNVVLLREWSLHETLAGNALRLQFPAAVVASGGVAAFESWDGQAVVLSVLTYAGTIHRFSFRVPAAPTAAASKAGMPVRSILKQDEAATTSSNVFTPKASYTTTGTTISSLQAGESITTALWINEYNLVVATDQGHLIGLNFGLPSSPDAVPQEFLFSDESVVQWLWSGLVKANARSRQRDGLSPLSAESIVNLTCFPLELGNGDDNDDVCIMALSADFTVRAWSFRNQTCLGKQNIRALVRTHEASVDSMSDDEEDSSDPECFAVHAKMVAIPSASSGLCRLLVHVDSTDEYEQQIVLLRGEIEIPSTRKELALEVARVFTVGRGKRLKFVDFVVDKNYLHSAWRSPSGDFVYSHANPMALTGPRIVSGHLVSSLDVQMKKFEAEDSELPLSVTQDGSEPRIDDYFADRVLLPGRFSRQNLYRAISEYHGGTDVAVRPYFAQLGLQHSRYKELLIRVVSAKWLDEASKRTKERVSFDPALLRVEIWQTIISLCTKHWRSESVPIGFAFATNSAVLGAPVLLRRNRVSLFFPAAGSIAAGMISEASLATRDFVRDISHDVLPVFDAFPSQTFQAAMQNEVSIASGNGFKVESLIALAKHSVRLALKPKHRSEGKIAELQLTKALRRLSMILGSDTSLHAQILESLVDALTPASSLQRDQPQDDPLGIHRSEDEDEDEMDGTLNPFRRCFNSSEMGYAMSQVTARTIDTLCVQALRVVLCFAHLVDAKLTFMQIATLRRVERVLLPRAIIVYQRWSLSRWIANQGVNTASDADPVAIAVPATLLPPLLQSFLLGANDSLNRVVTFRRARLVAITMRDFDTSDSEEPQRLLGAFASGILEMVSRPNDQLVAFLQQKKEFNLLRSLLSCSLNDLSLQHRCTRNIEATLRLKYTHSIGECLAWEGAQAARAEDNEEAGWCFKQSLRCLNMCLSSYCADVVADNHNVVKAEVCERFVNAAVQLLKETIPRGYYDLLLRFLWTIASEALQLIDSKSLKTFVWVNLFKYSVEQQAYHDAHLALMRAVHLSSLPRFSTKDQNGVDEQTTDDARTAIECAHFFVKELCRHGRLDLVCELEWGALENEVEQQLQWHAANVNPVKDGTVNASVVMYYQLLYAFYMRRNQPANAASAMYALHTRLRFAAIQSATVLKTQRNALLTATTVLRQVGMENRWVVRKLHAEEVPPTSKGSSAPLDVVTFDDMERELSVLEGKLRLLDVGQDERLLVSMDATEVVALLVDSALVGGPAQQDVTAAERQCESHEILELAVEIVAKNALGMEMITKSLARYCVSKVAQNGFSSPAWALLRKYLESIDELAQYEVAVATLLSWKVKLALPSWIRERLCCRSTGNAPKLLSMYLQHGLVIEAADVAAAMIPIEIVREDENAFLKRANATSAHLPLLPYNLFDAILAASDAILAMPAVPPEHAAALRASTQLLRERLMEYFKYVDVLEQASVASSVVQHSLGVA